jgi:hypothetical protein
MRRIEPEVRRIAGELLDPLIASGGGEVCSEFTRKLPGHVFAKFFSLPTALSMAIKEATVIYNQGKDVRRSSEPLSTIRRFYAFSSLYLLAPCLLACPAVFRPLEALALPVTPAEQNLNDVWNEHLRAEFSSHSADETIVTMSSNPLINQVPVTIGGDGREEVYEFYTKYFLNQIPPDAEMVPVSRTIGQGRLVNEMIFRFTHSISMDWMLPGIPPVVMICSDASPP